MASAIKTVGVLSLLSLTSVATPIQMDDNSQLPCTGTKTFHSVKPVGTGWKKFNSSGILTQEVDNSTSHRHRPVAVVITDPRVLADDADDETSMLVLCIP